MNELQQLQGWYESQCDGDWEHTYGLRIETLDNPGWSLTVDLEDTDLEAKEFRRSREAKPEQAEAGFTAKLKSESSQVARAPRISRRCCESSCTGRAPMGSNHSIERTSQRPLRALWSAAHV